MSGIVLASLFLPLSHFGLSSFRLRDLLAAKLGERGFLALYNLISLAAFAWLIAACRSAPTFILWRAPAALQLACLPIMLLAFVLAVAGITTPNPAVVGFAHLLDRPEIVRGILRVTRNAFFWGVGLWGLAHVALTGDLAHVLTFGSVAALGLIGAPVLDAKKHARHGARWRNFAAVTSSVPFLAIVQRRQRLVVAEIGWWRLALALMLFVIALCGHRWAFGVAALPGL